MVLVFKHSEYFSSLLSVYPRKNFIDEKKILFFYFFI